MRRTIFNFITMEDTGAYFILVLFSLCRGDTNRAILIYSHGEKLFLFSAPFLKNFGPLPATRIELPPQAADPLSKWLQPSAMKHNCYHFRFLLEVGNLVRCLSFSLEL